MTKSILWTFFALIVLSGCVTQQKCHEKFPPASAVKDSVHVRDSVAITYVPYIIPKDSIIFHDSVPCGDFYLDVEKKHNNITASLHIEAGKVTFKCLEDSLRAMLEQRDRTIASYESQKHDTVTDNAANNSKWYDPYCRWITLFIIVGIVVWLGWKIKSFMP